MFANFIILAHAVIPHHHHQQVPIYFLHGHHSEKADAHHHDHDADKHCHDADAHQHQSTTHDECIIGKDYVKTDNGKQISSSGNGQPLPDFIVLFCLQAENETIELYGLPFRQTPYLLSFYTEYVSRSLGLRAPPFC